MSLWDITEEFERIDWGKINKIATKIDGYKFAMKSFKDESVWEEFDRYLALDLDDVVGNYCTLEDAFDFVERGRREYDEIYQKWIKLYLKLEKFVYALMEKLWDRYQKSDKEIDEQNHDMVERLWNALQEYDMEMGKQDTCIENMCDIGKRFEY